LSKRTNNKNLQQRLNNVNIEEYLDMLVHSQLYLAIKRSKRVYQKVGYELTTIILVPLQLL
jgi:hypothetical protein